MNSWVFFCASLFVVTSISAAHSSDFALGGIELREPISGDFYNHYNCFPRPEFYDLTQCDLTNANFRNTNPFMAPDAVIESPDGRVLLAYTQSLESGDLNQIARSVIALFSQELSGTVPTIQELDGTVFALWGDTRVEEIATGTDEYQEIVGFIEPKYGFVVPPTGNPASTKEQFQPVYRVIGGDGFVAIFSEFEPDQIVVQRFAVAAGTLAEKNFEAQARQFPERDKSWPADDFSKWDDVAFLIRRLALNTTPEFANSVVDRVFDRPGNRKYYSHVWAFLPTSVIKHLGKNVYSAVDVFGENTEFPEIRSRMLAQVEAAPSGPYSEFLLYALGRFDEAVELNRDSPIETVLLYALAHSQLRNVLSGLVGEIARGDHQEMLASRVTDYSYRKGEGTYSYTAPTAEDRNRQLAERNFFYSNAYANISPSRDDYEDGMPTLSQLLSYLNRFPERYNSAPLVNTVPEFVAQTDRLMPMFEAVAKNRESAHYDDASYFLAWLTFHRGNVNEALDRFGYVIGMIQANDSGLRYDRPDYSGTALWQINRIFRTLPPDEVFDRVQSSSALSPQPVVWLTVLTTFYQTHQYELVIAGARRALNHFGVTIEDLPVTTDPRRISTTFEKFLPRSHYLLQEVAYLYHSSREISEMVNTLRELERHSISSVHDRLRELINKYALVSNSDLEKMYSDRSTKPRHKDLRQSLYLLDRSLELLPQSGTHSKFRHWLHYKRIRLLAQFHPIEVSAANAAFQKEFPSSELIDDGIAEQVLAEAVIIGDMERATETFDLLRRRFPNANALDNAHSWMAIGWTCKGRPDKAREIDRQILRLFPLTRHAGYARQRTENPKACLELRNYYAWDYEAMRWRERNRIDTIQASFNDGTVAKFPPRPARPANDSASTNRLPITNNQAKQMASTLLDMHARSGESALRELGAVYAGSVDYFGKITTWDEVMQDKSQYFDRWPIRHYEVERNSLLADCSGGEVCTVSGHFDWSVNSPQRNKQADGTARFEFTITAHPPHQVLRESSEVVERR
ncbi:MAG: hypothetical protein GY789_01765 [Hyphomicrobiales bacterium]|nr:hypothetical protein [Hyphomicrobiales bacterium]